jgi:8-oxo-dGTP pyrophosphatase MutT (NUDIX family)
VSSTHWVMTMVDDPALRERLRARLEPVGRDDADLPMRGDGDLNGQHSPTGQTLRPASVLVPLVLHDGPARLVLTERAAHLNQHAGQVSFPGGRVEVGQETGAEAALREVEEEIGIRPDQVELVGQFDAYETVTGFRVTPFVGIIAPGYNIVADPNEVADVFEAPFEFLMDPANHQRQSRVWQGRRRYFYAMPWQERYIWGATAGMLKALHDRLYG